MLNLIINQRASARRRGLTQDDVLIYDGQKAKVLGFTCVRLIAVVAGIALFLWSILTFGLGTSAGGRLDDSATLPSLRPGDSALDFANLRDAKMKDLRFPN